MESSESTRIANETILRFTRKKLLDVTDTIAQLKEEDFPHEYSLAALKSIEEQFSDRLDALSNTSAKNDASVVSRVCKEATETLEQFLPLLGFIARSTHIRNAFELHGPVLRLVIKALGKDAKLTLSSEWEFSPFMYMPPIDNRRHVMIGLPASESSNALIIPLAGHELGHSIWEHGQYGKKYRDKLIDVIVSLIQTKHWDEFNEHFPEVAKDQVNDLLGRANWRISWGWAARQCEEIFCDFIGLIVFGRSYLYAFAYLLAPGPVEDRKIGTYPTVSDRVDILLKASAVLGITPPLEFRGQFDPNRDGKDDDFAFFLNLADDAALALFDDMLGDARSFCNTHGIGSGKDAEVERIAKSFNKLVPAQQVTSLEDIINAGWKVYSDKSTSVSDSARRDEAQIVLNELVLKTVEVFEIEQLLVSH